MLGIGDFARLGGVTARTLRHYGERDLLHPARVDAATGYRWYSLDQLADLHRIVALRELGIGLDEIRRLVAEEVGVERLRELLAARRDDLAASLRRIEAHLDAIDRGGLVQHPLDIVVKQADPLRVAAATFRAPGFGYDNINPLFEQHLERITTTLLDQGLSFGPCVAFYEEDGDDAVMHLGWDVGDQHVEEVDGIEVTELPVVEVASVVHRGSMENVVTLFESMVRWIEANGYELRWYTRELYWHLDMDQSKQVTELQIPIRAKREEACPSPT
jgi:DNA-binding transcriptional MerR regulator